MDTTQNRAPSKVFAGMITSQQEETVLARLDSRINRTPAAVFRLGDWALRNGSPLYAFFMATRMPLQPALMMAEAMEEHGAYMDGYACVKHVWRQHEGEPQATPHAVRTALHIAAAARVAGRRASAHEIVKDIPKALPLATQDCGPEQQVLASIRAELEGKAASPVPTSLGWVRALPHDRLPEPESRRAPAPVVPATREDISRRVTAFQRALMRVPNVKNHAMQYENTRQLLDAYRDSVPDAERYFVAAALRIAGEALKSGAPLDAGVITSSLLDLVPQGTTLHQRVSVFHKEVRAAMPTPPRIKRAKTKSAIARPA